MNFHASVRITGPNGHEYRFESTEVAEYYVGTELDGDDVIQVLKLKLCSKPPCDGAADLASHRFCSPDEAYFRGLLPKLGVKWQDLNAAEQTAVNEIVARFAAKQAEESKQAGRDFIRSIAEIAKSKPESRRSEDEKKAIAAWAEISAESNADAPAIIDRKRNEQ